ncbi:AMP-dependent synthetase and ligase [Candidatus Rickettsiella viridis]|uniref:AMP-dependent synthetase and ligase n=1 Tax=Candidatus Rickettsiella viridis TaxID=676208 RepID=A0A2Z5UUV2_9COXI|nr:acyl-[ACP]--phospholipid O-acyltransferase [Candidatus Rickettsiella viridis]BBB14791.1 AMP-dependent synthetase and ligase [Candidatus Rickettsiella viridis]
MPALPQFSLLKSQRFLPLFIIQFFGAFNDNVFKNALIVLITYQFVSQSKLWQELSVTLAAGLFILPFFLFSALAGQLADKLSKRNLIIIIKCLELAFMALASLGFYLHAVGLLMLTLFLMGTHSTFFGPIKYAILPDLLQKNELLGGNALIEASTFIAILLGTLLGGFLIVAQAGITWVSIIMLSASVMGLLASFYVPTTPKANPHLKINPRFIQATFEIIRQVKTEKKVFWAILAISWFWLIGATFLTQFPIFSKNFLKANASVVTIFLAIFTVGVALGSLLCNRLLKQKIGMQWIPLSLWLMSFFMIDLYFASRHLPLLTKGSHSLIGLRDFFYSISHWRICLDLLGLSMSAGVYIVPLYTLIQIDTVIGHRARSIAANNIINSLFIVVGSLVVLFLFKIDLSIIQIFLLLGILNLVIAMVTIFFIPEGLIKPVLRWVLKHLYDVKLTGFEHYKSAGDSVVIVANHTSFLDVVLLYAFLPDDLLFAINRFTARIWWVRPFLYFAKVFELDPLNPLAIKTLIHEVKRPGKCVIFPEGRITTTGALMKLYEGPGLIADHAKANLLPIRLQGAQYTHFSRLRGKVQIRWFPKISITILPPRRFVVDPTMSSRKRRQLIGVQLYEIMVEMLFRSTDYKKTLFQSFLEAKAIHKGPTKVLEDITRVPLNYNQLLTRCFILGSAIDRLTEYQETVGLLLPNMIGAVVTFFTLQAYGRVPALLNYSAGSAQIEAACRVAKIRCVLTSRKFIEAADLFNIILALSEQAIQIVYLEDIKAEISWKDKLRAALLSRFPHYYYHRKLKKITNTSDPAVVLFTSGSEGEPKGVVLSHENIQANMAQMTTQIDFNQKDIFFSALPLFHAFGLTACVILPIYHGIKTFIYPSPLHYRKVPNMIYECNATITFGTDTFLAGYGRYAHPYDFYSIRYVFAGAEKLKEKTRKLWMEKFGIRIFEGYGVTEASPVISVNTPMQNKPGTVGNFLPGIRYEIEPVAHIKDGGRLLVSGPNIMLGYLSAEQPGEIMPPSHGWYDTGDIVEVDGDGYLSIKDRAKRFAKISGEMVSLTAVENAIYDLWPDKHHAVLTIADARKGEQLILVTEYKLATRNDLLKFYQEKGLSELNLPRRLYFIDVMPLLGSGKVSYMEVKKWLENQR